ncbi:MAG: biopolymer transporter ExbD [Oligoflexia bacterium]|nr:biopolymer transporter ExbD [Oligoflexia bacterium]
MGASGLGGGGKKSVNVDLNLVPFIDLLSTLICFLLITAVWQQINVLTTDSASTTASESATPPDPNRIDLSLSLMMDHVLAAEGEKNTRINHLQGEPDYNSLMRLLNDWKTRHPDRKDVTLNTDSQAPYKQLIRLMDTLITADFEDVGVNTN